MRLICTIKEQEGTSPFAFSRYLASQGIENTCDELEREKGVFRVWVHDEDQVEKALMLYQAFQANPTDHQFASSSSMAHEIQEEHATSATDTPQKGASPPPPRRRILSPSPYGPISIFFLLLVVAVFLFSQMQRDVALPPRLTGVIEAPLLAPIEKALLFDYPLYFTLRDAFYKVYTPKEIEEETPPSSEALSLFQQMQRTPVWMGFYDQFLAHYRSAESPLHYEGPLFEKIREGQFWRLFTPVLLHIDLLHIFFNLLWFVLLGNQIEFRIGWWRYIAFILIAGIVANTAQYLVSGPFFMGLSGVVVAMAAFIWARQQQAPWEGYLLSRFTLVFLGIFVVGLFVLQIALFAMQLFGQHGLSVGVANTAHLAGAVVGYTLGRLRLFALQTKIPRV